MPTRSGNIPRIGYVSLRLKNGLGHDLARLITIHHLWAAKRRKWLYIEDSADVLGPFLISLRTLSENMVSL